MTVLVAGLPGAGKSTWAKKRFRRVLEFDDIALRLGSHAELDEDGDRNLALRQFALRAPSFDAVVDVFMTRETRASILDSCRGQCGIVVVATPLDACLQRNAARLPLKVSSEELMSVAMSFEPVSPDEGFKFVQIVDNGASIMKSPTIYIKVVNGSVLAYGDEDSLAAAEAKHKTGRLYDFAVPGADWDASGGQAEVVDGRLVLADPARVDYERQAEIIRNERYIRMKPADRISPMRWNAMTEEQRQAWTDYRQALLDIPQQEGFPWGGDPDAVPWPAKPE